MILSKPYDMIDMAHIIIILKSSESSSTREVVGEVSEMSRSDLEKFYNATFQDFNIKACTFLGRRCTVRLSNLILSTEPGSFSVLGHLLANLVQKFFF